MTRANPFRNSVMRRSHDEAAQAYANRSKVLFLADGARNRGNAIAGPFWNGFDGLQADKWDPASRKTLVYAYWRAGQDAARQPTANAT